MSSIGQEIPIIITANFEHRHGGMSCSSSKIDKKEIRLPARWACLIRNPQSEIRNRTIRSVGFSCQTFVSTAKKPVVLRRVQPDQLCALKLAQCWCRTMFATVAVTASSHVRSE